jgi:hypothetical protein
LAQDTTGLVTTQPFHSPHASAWGSSSDSIPATVSTVSKEGFKFFGVVSAFKTVETVYKPSEGSRNPKLKHGENERLTLHMRI